MKPSLPVWNKYGTVNLEYMTSLTDVSEEEIRQQLKGRIYYNPQTDEYEAADKFISGNVIEKADRIEAFLLQNPDHAPAQESLAGSARGDSQAHCLR